MMNAPATKEQERQALEKIRKIVDELGDGSYVGMAFEGCFDDAEDNIRNDFGCSMKQRWESAESDLGEAEQKINTLKEQVAHLQEMNEELKKKVLEKDDLALLAQIAARRVQELQTYEDEAAKKIVEYADRTGSDEFKQAVADHRWLVAEERSCSAVHERVLEANRY